jgi:hypothetical protein
LDPLEAAKFRYIKDGDRSFFWRIGNSAPICTASHPRTP